MIRLIVEDANDVFVRDAQVFKGVPPIRPRDGFYTGVPLARARCPQIYRGSIDGALGSQDEAVEGALIICLGPDGCNCKYADGYYYQEQSF